MKMTTKFLSIILSAVIIAGSVSVSVSAAEAAPADTTTVAPVPVTAIQPLVTTKVVNGMEMCVYTFTKSGVPIYWWADFADVPEYVINEILPTEWLDYIDAAGIKPTMTDLEKAATLAVYMANASVYDYASAKLALAHQISCAENVIINHMGICSDFAETYNTLCELLGITTYSCENASHIWSAVLIDNQIFYVDVTWMCCSKQNPERMLGWFFKDYNTFYNINGHPVADSIYLYLY